MLSYESTLSLIQRIVLNVCFRRPNYEIKDIKLCAESADMSLLRL